MGFAWFVARRYLTARRKQAFISLISGVSILGVGVGVMALVIASAIMTGVQTDLRDRIVGSSAHIYVYKASSDGLADVDAEIKKLMLPGVIGAAPATMDVALAVVPGRDIHGITIKGVDPAREPQVTDITRLQDAIRALLKVEPDEDAWRTGSYEGKELWLLPNEVGGLTLLFPDDY